MKAILRRLATDERAAFAQYVRDEISTEPIGEAYSNRPKALRALARDLEADDEPTMFPLFGTHDTQHREAEVEGEHEFSAESAVVMNPILMAAVVDFSIFLNLNKAKGLDRETASELLEYLATRLHELSLADRKVFARYVEYEAKVERRTSDSSSRLDQLLMFNENYGLTDESYGMTK